MGRRRLERVVLVVTAPVAVAVVVPVFTPRRCARTGAGARSGTVSTVPAAGARRRRRERRGRRELSFRRHGLLVLGDVGIRIPVVEVAGGAVHQPAPRLRHRRVVRRVPWGRGSRHRCRQIWANTWSPARARADSPAEGQVRCAAAAARRGAIAFLFLLFDLIFRVYLAYYYCDVKF